MSFASFVRAPLATTAALLGDRWVRRARAAIRNRTMSSIELSQGEVFEGSEDAWSADRLKRTLRKHLPESDVIVVANREPYIHERTSDGALRVIHPASGLVTALEPVVLACSGVWIGHGSGSADREACDRKGRLLVPPGEDAYLLRRIWLSRDEEQGYYYGFSNQTLWPLCHLVHTRPVFEAEHYAQYVRVNRKFAQAVCEEAKGEDPIVFVQDYHFALLPKMIREKLPRATIITFWHIPWPNAERFDICPWKEELLEGLLGSSILGFHTQQHCNNFLEAVDRSLEARVDKEEDAIVHRGDTTHVRAYPISIDWPNRWTEEAPSVEECRQALRKELGLPKDALIGVGVDRLDYTKGIVERFLAVERLLTKHRGYRGRFTFVQIAAPSRTAIASYQELEKQVLSVVSRINRKFGRGAYKPIVLRSFHHEPSEVFLHYRAADLCYVSSLHDGMNLVAKEFVAARDDEQGVLVLSRFTGASRELAEALQVNPYDIDGAAEALATALSMPMAEQRARMRAMRATVAEHNVYRWAGRILLDAARTRQRARLSYRLEHAASGIRAGVSA